MWSDIVSVSVLFRIICYNFGFGILISHLIHWYSYITFDSFMRWCKVRFLLISNHFWFDIDMQCFVLSNRYCILIVLSLFSQDDWKISKCYEFMVMAWMELWNLWISPLCTVLVLFHMFNAPTPNLFQKVNGAIPSIRPKRIWKQVSHKPHPPNFKIKTPTHYLIYHETWSSISCFCEASRKR